VSLEPSNLAIVEPMAALQRFALLHPDTCRHARIFPALIFRTECLEPGCVGVKIASLSSCKTHWSTKHCTCNLVSCVCFPAEKYEPLFVKAVNKVAVHHNQVGVSSAAGTCGAASALCDRPARPGHRRARLHTPGRSLG